jgi:2,3-bisphosphoglycerate-independent phosphoglycerate mutase
MKYLIIIGDGMADRPLAELGNKTLIEASSTPNLDRLAREGCGGLVQTIPESCEPGSDVANLAILGYDPEQYYTGRAPLEAVSLGIELGGPDIAFRCNLVSTSGDRLTDYCAGHISTNEARGAIKKLQESLAADSVEFFPGVSYRHLMIYRNAPHSWKTTAFKTTPPHDFTGKLFTDYLPQGELAGVIIDLMKQSRKILSTLAVNEHRKAEGKNTADMIWLWGQGGAVELPTIPDRWKLQGAVISAVDLVRGIGTCAGLKVEIVEGATGYIDTNYAGKVERALAVLKEKDLVYLHVEAPDEAGHSGNWKIKQQAIEDFDAKIVGPIIQGMKQFGEYRILIMPDHATPIEIKTHSREPVPFIIYPAFKNKPDAIQFYSEAQGAAGRYNLKKGHELLHLFITGNESDQL